jgi:hypothetical protein
VNTFINPELSLGPPSVFLSFAQGTQLDKGFPRPTCWKPLSNTEYLIIKVGSNIRSFACHQHVGHYVTNVDGHVCPRAQHAAGASRPAAECLLSSSHHPTDDDDAAPDSMTS